MGTDLISASRDYVSDQSRAVWAQDSQQAGICTLAAALCLRTRQTRQTMSGSRGIQPTWPDTTPDQSLTVISGGCEGKPLSCAHTAAPAPIHSQLFPPLLLLFWAHPIPESLAEQKHISELPTLQLECSNSLRHIFPKPALGGEGLSIQENTVLCFMDPHSIHPMGTTSSFLMVCTN